MRDIKQRIANVSSTEQIIKAMDMIASTKLNKARAQLEGVRPIYCSLDRIIKEIGTQQGAETNIFYKERKVKNSLYIIQTSDRGFSGGYNQNILNAAIEHMSTGKNEKIVVVGLKGYEYFLSRNKNIIHKITNVPESQVYYGTESLSRRLSELYVSGEVDEVFVGYTQFENILSYVPRIEKILPLPLGETNIHEDKKYEPDIDTYIEQTVPLFLHMYLFRAFSESYTSEQAARMVNMDAAGKNASDMIDKLTRMYNRRRQAEITQEISEIVGSTNILNKG